MRVGGGAARSGVGECVVGGVGGSDDCTRETGKREQSLVREARIEQLGLDTNIADCGCCIQLKRRLYVVAEELFLPSVR